MSNRELNLATIAKQLIYRLRKHEPASLVASRAMTYLNREGLMGSPLRDEQALPEEVDGLEILSAALRKANDQAEHFEREWYLRGDEIEEQRQLCDRLSDLLTRTAIALKGPQPPLTLHDWSDLPEVAAALAAPPAQPVLRDPAYRTFEQFMALKDAPDIDCSESARQGWNACARLYNLPVYCTSIAAHPAEPSTRCADCQTPNSCNGDDLCLEQYIKGRIESERLRLNEAEVALIDGMIEVQKHHASQCDGIANRRMAEKQKAWDLSRVAVLEKVKAAAQ